MKSKLMFLGLAAALHFSSALIAQATEIDAAPELNPEAHHGYRYRVDLACSFENGEDCKAYASIYTNRSMFPTELGGGGGGGGGKIVVNHNRMAIFCKDHGMVYANAATSSWHHKHLVISSANGGRPRIVIDRTMPIQPGATTDGPELPAELLLRNGNEINGTCKVRIKDFS
ncbi:MAG: hypothetical protein ACK5QT_10250 [Oligoflexia bacterium]